MNTQSDAIRDSAVKAAPVAPTVITPWQSFYWSVRRELWENRSVYLAPLGVAAVFLLGFLISTFHLPGRMRGLSGLDPVHYQDAIELPYDIAAGLMMLTGIVVSVFYCADALYSERRDRSILFWKSLPVSDLTAVLAKASIPFVIVPLLVSAIAIAMQFIMLVMSSVALLGSGVSIASLWTQLPLVQMSLLMLYHIATAHALWPAPVYSWLLLVSGWARRAVFLWAALPVLAIAGLEAIAFRTSHFAALVGSRLIGGGTNVVQSPDRMFPTNPMVHPMPGHFLMSLGLWGGLLLTAAFLALAVRLRRYRAPI